MPEPWWRGRLVGLDLETTSPLPQEARLVTAALVVVGGGEETEAYCWVADPGVEIPEEAAAVHGFTTERVRAEGRPARDVLTEVMDRLVAELALGRPLVIFNARYDLTVLDRECRRHGIKTLADRGITLLIVDPLVFEKWLDRFRLTRETGTRKLAGMCEHYARRWAAATGRRVPVVLAGAHDAEFDALAACRLAWLIASMPAEYAVVREPRTWGGHYYADLAERDAMIVEWGAVKDNVEALHEWTAREADAERRRFAEYRRSCGDNEGADRVEAERGWPVLDLLPDEIPASAR